MRFADQIRFWNCFCTLFSLPGLRHQSPGVVCTWNQSCWSSNWAWGESRFPSGRRISIRKHLGPESALVEPDRKAELPFWERPAPLGADLGDQWLMVGLRARLYFLMWGYTPRHWEMGRKFNIIWLSPGDACWVLWGPHHGIGLVVLGQVIEGVSGVDACAFSINRPGTGNSSRDQRCSMHHCSPNTPARRSWMCILVVCPIGWCLCTAGDRVMIEGLTDFGCFVVIIMYLVLWLSL